MIELIECEGCRRERESERRIRKRSRLGKRARGRGGKRIRNRPRLVERRGRGTGERGKDRARLVECEGGKGDRAGEVEIARRGVRRVGEGSARGRCACEIRVLAFGFEDGLRYGFAQFLAVVDPRHVVPFVFNL